MNVKLYKCKVSGRVEFIPMVDGFAMFYLFPNLDQPGWGAFPCANDRLKEKAWTHVQLSNFLELLVQTGWTKKRVMEEIEATTNGSI